LHMSMSTAIFGGLEFDKHIKILLILPFAPSYPMYSTYMLNILLICYYGVTPPTQRRQEKIGPAAWCFFKAPARRHLSSHIGLRLHDSRP
jgi:hypothetical protein